MKTIGLIGGMSWESTVPYYRIVNEEVKKQLGGLHSAKVVLYSVDFHEIEQLQHSGDWDAAGALLADAARALQAAGAECGPIGDGCGGLIDCGPCTAPDTCGGGGTPFKCGHPQVK